MLGQQKKSDNIVNILGIGIEAITYSNMLDRVEQWLKDKKSRSHHIATINSYCTVLSLYDQRLYKIYNSADITGADGEPFVKWIRYFYKYACDKICARDVILQLIERAKTTKYSFYLYGGHSDVLNQMVKNLKLEYPYLNIVGSYSPPFRPITEYEDKQIIDDINFLKPDIILVGLGTPKQDYWIDEHIDSIRGSVMVTCGATFDFFGGRIKMAPKWIQKSCLEWLYRLFSKHFKRLWKRYTLYNIIFLWNFFLQNSKIKTRAIIRIKR